jgi:hypothetical protein
MDVDSHAAALVEARGPETSRVGPAARRWVRIVPVVAFLSDDVRTLDDWAAQAGVSRGTLKCWCAGAGVRAKDSLDFARVFRAVIQHAGEWWDPYNVLDIVEPRTLNRLLSRAAVPSASTVPDVVSFLEAQQLVRSPVLLTAGAVPARSSAEFPAVPAL